MQLSTGIYIHWPYCDRICPYCDFNIVKNRDVDAALWGRVLIEDILFWAERTGAREIKSIYFGGGTPSLMPLTLIDDMLEAIYSSYSVSADTEITLEANPVDAEMVCLRAWKKAGITRLSLGIQSFDDQHLSFLGRNHDGLSARRSLGKALEVFDDLTFDTIYGVPEETLTSWRKRIAEVAACGSPHLSVYQLTIEPNTAFARAVHRGDWSPCEDDILAEYHDAARDELEARQYEAYEISSYAKAGKRARHNSLYWRGGDWIGIGPGAAGRLTLKRGRFETRGTRGIRDYLSNDQSSRYYIEKLTENDVLIEMLAGGLRLVDGISAEKLGPWWEKVKQAALPFSEQGLLSISDTAIAVTRRGQLVTDGLVRELISSL